MEITSTSPLSFFPMEELDTEPLQDFKITTETGQPLAPLTPRRKLSGSSNGKWMAAEDVDTGMAMIKKNSLTPSVASTMCPENLCMLPSDGGSGEMMIVDEDGDGASSDKQKEEATTMMICNIPCRFNHEAIIDALVAPGFAGTYDFVFIPDRKNRRTRGNSKSKGNIGYAFVNFYSMQHAEAFAATFQDFQFPGNPKKCEVKFANHQGFNATFDPSARRTNVRVIEEKEAQEET
jgi:hypothetical protein